MRALSRPADPDNGLQELFDLWSASTADALHRVLVLHQPVRGSADAHEPFALLQKHHKTEPAFSLTTALLLLTDRRWRNGAAQLVRSIADAGILEAEQLDLLASTFLAVDDALYWQVPDAWFAGGEVVFDVETPADETPADVAVTAPEGMGPTVARRDVFPPLRRWAASYVVAREPAAWPALLTRANEVNARNAAAIAAGLLDRIDVLTPDAQAFLVRRATVWPDHAVRRLALEYIATRDGIDAAILLARDDPNARIRAWAATLTSPSTADPPDAAAGERTGPRRTTAVVQPGLF